MSEGRIRVFIAEGSSVFGRGLSSCLAESHDMNVVGQVRAGADLPGLLETGQFDVMLLDATLSGLEGFALVQQIREVCPKAPILLVGASADVRWLLRGIRTGASGVISREAAPEEFCAAIRRVHSGHLYIAEHLAEKLVLFYQRNEGEPLEERLSPREFEVMKHLSAGMKLSEIARKLNISHQTVTTHRRHILEKTGLRTTAEIIRYGILNGLGQPQDDRARNVIPTW